MNYDVVYFGDCIKGMQENVSDESVDLIIADPPFEVETNGCGHENHKEYYLFSIKWMTEAMRALKEHGAMYVYCSWNHLRDTLNAIFHAGFTNRGHLIWWRTYAPDSYCKWLSTHYHILFCTKSNDPMDREHPRLMYTDILKPHPKLGHLYNHPDSVLTHRTIQPDDDGKDGSRLPLEQVELLIKTSSKEGEVILDPFVGNGTTIEAAIRLHRHFLGFEANPEYRIVLERLFRRYHMIPPPIRELAT